MVMVGTVMIVGAVMMRVVVVVVMTIGRKRGVVGGKWRG